MYPAYPQHFFSLWGLVHICIPHTGTPCGRVIGLKVLPTLVGLSLWDCLTLAFCTLIISHFKGFVKGKFQLLFHSSVMGFEPLGSDASLQPRCSLPLTPIVYHMGGGLSIGNIAQIRDLKLLNICLICLLTNWLDCGIMEILGRANVAEATQFSNKKAYPFRGGRLLVSTQTTSPGSRGTAWR